MSINSAVATALAIKHILCKMKFAIVLFALVAATAAAPSSKSLKDDFEEIIALLPLEEMRQIARNHLDNDAEFQRVVAYLQGPEWAALVAAVRENPTWKDFKVYLNEAGIDVEAIIDFIHNLITGAKPNGRATRSIREFLDEIKAIIPKKELLALINDKLTNSKDFQEFYSKISSEKSHALFDEVRAMPEVQRVAAVLKEMGVDIDKVLDFIYIFLGWK